MDPSQPSMYSSAPRTNSPSSWTVQQLASPIRELWRLWGSSATRPQQPVLHAPTCLRNCSHPLAEGRQCPFKPEAASGNMTGREVLLDLAKAWALFPGLAWGLSASNWWSFCLPALVPPFLALSLEPASQSSPQFPQRQQGAQQLAGTAPTTHNLLEQVRV